MKHKPIPWAIALTGVLYYALLIYWQSDELSGSGQARDAAVFGLVFSVAYVAYCMLCFQTVSYTHLTLPTTPYV